MSDNKSLRICYISCVDEKNIKIIHKEKQSI